MIYIIVIIVVLVILLLSLYYIFDTSKKNQILTCTSKGNFWIGKCIPPNAASIECVISGQSWVNSACVTPSEAQQIENVLLCSKNKDVFMDDTCVNKNKLTEMVCKN